MSAPYKPEEVERQRRIIAELIARPEGAMYEEIAKALDITQGGANYRINRLIELGQAWSAQETRSAKKRAFSTREAMEAWKTKQPEPYSKIVQDMLAERQPITAAEFGKVIGVSTQNASSYLAPMSRRGEIFGVSVGHTMFWYRSESDAKRGKVKAERELAQLMAQRTQKAMAARGRAMKPAIPANVTVMDRAVSFRDKPAQITSKTRVTVQPPPPFVCRWQQQPDSGQSIFADWPRYGTGA